MYVFLDFKNALIPRGCIVTFANALVSFLNNTDGRIAPRSGLASKHHIDTGAGVIDADYRGEVKVLLFNHSVVGFGVGVGDRVAQLIVERIFTPDVVVVEGDLDASVRGGGGFGSTGLSGVVPATGVPAGAADGGDLGN